MVNLTFSQNSALKRWFAQREKNCNRIEKVISTQISKLRIEARLQAKGNALAAIGGVSNASNAVAGNAVHGRANMDNAPAKP